MFKRSQRNLRQAFSRIFQRYCDTHFVIHLDGSTIAPFADNPSGYIDKYSIGATGTSVDGWTTAEKVSLAPAGEFVWTEPNIRRDDASRKLNLPTTSQLGFSLRATRSDTLVFAVKSGTETLVMPLPRPTRIQRISAKLNVTLSFARDVFRSFPRLLAAWQKPSTQALQAAKKGLRLQADDTDKLIDSTILRPGKTKPHKQTVSIVMPVFNAIEVLEASLKRVADGTFGPWRMILVNDCSTDPKISTCLENFAKLQTSADVDVQILQTPSNLGFVGAANMGLQAAAKFGDHVVLLNSDAMVPKNWLSRLINPILQDPSIASVTPLSNDAEILSTPKNCAPTPLSADTIDAIDAALAKTIAPAATIQIPTGIGFCMAMNSKYLALHPHFDPVFGRGYGEEVDWCNRSLKSGGKNVGLAALYVGHVGSASFEEVEKQKILQNHNRIISRKYPKFDKSVQSFIEADPILTARLITAIAQASATQPTLEIYLGHSMGGGANQYLDDQINRNRQALRSTIVLRVGGHRRWQVEVHTPFTKVIAQSNIFDTVTKILSTIQNGKLIYSCGVGDCDPVSIPELLLDLKAALACGLKVLFHDYFPLNPSYCLLNEDNVYVGPKGIPTNTIVSKSNGKSINLRQWQASWRGFVAAANEVTFFSRSSEKIVSEVFNLDTQKVKICPHSLNDLVLKKAETKVQSSGFSPNIGVLGDIGIQKGAQLVGQISSIISNSEVFESIVVVGHLDPGIPKSSTLTETGQYNRQDINILSADNRIACWLIPSIWPETFCFTIHEALQTGLPVFCFDLGAQAEVAAKFPNGHILPFDIANNPRKTLTSIERVLSNVQSMPGAVLSTQRDGRRGIAAR
jgi:GT2 family glycosyltransferase